MSSLLPAQLQDLGSNLPLPPPELLAVLARHELLTSWFQRRLLEELASFPIPASPDTASPPSEEESEAQLLAYARRCGLDGVEDLDPWRRSRGLSLADLDALASFDQRVERASQWLWSQELPGLYMQRRGDFDQVVLSMVRVRDPDLATELFFQLQEGECTFHEVVDLHAEEADRLRRGVLGPLPVNRLNPLLMRVVRRYKPGELIPPLDLNGFVHLIRVESLQPTPLDDRLRTQLLADCRNRWLRDQLLRLRDRLREGTTPLEVAS